MAMDVEVKAPAEGEAKPKAPEAKPAAAGEPLDPESEAQAISQMGGGGQVPNMQGAA